MIKNTFCIIFVSLFLTTNISANSLERNFLIKFDGLCVQNIDKIELVNSFAEANKWMVLPPEQEALIAPRVKGPAFKAYAFIENNNVFMIGINDAEQKDSCTMVSKYNSLVEFKNTLKEFYKVKLANKTSQGVQIMEFYNIDLIQSEEGILFLNYSEQKGLEFISISIMVPKKN